MTQQGGGQGRPPGGPPWPEQPQQGQWPQQPPQHQQPQHDPQQGQWPQQPPQQHPHYPPPQQQQPYGYPPQQAPYQQPQYQQPQYPQPQHQQPQHQQPPYQQPPHQQPQRPPTQPPAGGASLGTAISRAFRYRIDPTEVTDHERDKLLAAGITSPTVQAFLAWRRSLLLLAAIGILPVLGLRIYDTTKQEGNPGTLNALLAAQLVVDIIFALILWSQIGKWTNWRRQRRVIAFGWVLYFIMPFLIWLYPVRTIFDDALGQQGALDPTATAAAHMLFGVLASFAAMVELAPRAVALLPGILRGSITAKLLFPGASGPGWLVLLLAPIYATIMYIVLLIPYQVTASGFFVAAMAGFIGAQLWMGRMGFKLARPERIDEALALVKRIRGTYLLLNLFGIVFAVVGVYQLFDQLDIPYVQMAKLFINVLVSVLLLTLVATDIIVANLARGQALLHEPGTQQAYATFQRDVSQFADPVVSSQQQQGPR